jgi:hypothetical protein
MKSYSIVTTISLFIIFSFTIGFSQIPNSDFEDWNNGVPVGWFANNIPNVANAVSQTNDCCSGSSAARLETLTWLSLPFPPSLQAGESGFGIPITYRPAEFKGNFKIAPQADDVLSVAILLTKNQNMIGVGSGKYGEVQSTFAEFIIPIDYTSAEIPDKATISFAITDTMDGVSTVGSWAIIDDVDFTDEITTFKDLQQMPIEYSLAQNYPNPFNPITTISYSIPNKSTVLLNIYNVLGELVSQLINEDQYPGVYKADWNASNHVSGIYFYELKAGTFSKTKKLIVLK